MRPFLALACVLLSCATRHASPPAPAAAESPPLLQLPDGVRPLRYALDLEVVPERPEFRGTAEIEIELSSPRTFIWMHGRGLRVSRASIEAGAVAPMAAVFQQVNDDGVAKLSFPRPVGPGRATLRFAWTADWDRDLVGLYLSRSGPDAYAVTQLETLYARRVFPSFDEPRFKTPFDVTLTVPAASVAVSNGPALSEDPAGEGLRRVVFATTPPLPTYLVFVAAGPFDVVTPAALPPTAIRERPLPLRGLAPKGHGPELAFALEATAAFVPWYEEYFGIAFPYAKLDQLALPDFMWGGMENAGAIAYRADWLLASAGTPEDTRRRIALLVAHEISHQWFGDLVTLPWWTDAWLNESFAEWVATRAAARWRPDWNLDVLFVRSAEAVMTEDSLSSSRAVRQPLRDMAEVDGQFDGMSYQKGSAVLAGFERMMGEERFRGGIREYLRAHLHGTATAESLYTALSRAAGRDIAPALASFTDRPGVPLVTARVECDQSGARLAVSLSRWQPLRSGASSEGHWQLPLCLRWEKAGRQSETCTLLADSDETLPLGPTCPDWLIPHAGAMAYQRWTLAPADLARLRAAAVARLTAAEKVSLVRNLRAAQQSGTVDWGHGMAAIGDLAADPDPEVAIEPIQVLVQTADRLLAPEARDALAAYASARYRPILERLGWEAGASESGAAKRLRAAVIDLLAFTVRDGAVRREAARRGSAFLGLDGGAPVPSAIDADSAEVAFAAFVAEGGERAFDALAARLLTTEDASLRMRIVGALTRPEDPAIAARAAELWSRPEVRKPERRWAVLNLGKHGTGRAALLTVLERSPDAVIEALPPLQRTFFPQNVASACDAESAERLRATLEPRLETYPQMRRALAQALEKIHSCAAERERSGAAAGMFFARAVGRP